MNNPDTVTKILDAIDNNQFLEIIHELYIKDINNKGTLFNTLAELHNSGQLDIFNEFSNLQNVSQKNNFWRNKAIFQQILPLIEIQDISKALICMDRFIQNAGNNGAARSILPVFETKLINDEKLLEQVLQVFLQNPSLYQEFLGIIIFAGATNDFKRYLDINLQLIDSLEKSVKSRAIYMLGEFNYTDDQDLKVAFEKLVLLGKDEGDDEVLANVIHAYLRLMYKNPNRFNEYAESFCESIIAKGGINTAYNISSLLFMQSHGNESTNNHDVIALTKKVYSYLQNNNASQPGTINNIGSAFPTNYNSELNKEYLKLIEFHLENGITLGQFNIDHHLTEDTELFEKIITRWLGLNSPIIALAVRDLFHLDDKTLLKPNFSFVESKFEFINFMIARKAIGCLLANQSILLYFLIHLMDASSEEIATDIANHIYHFILINYPSQKDNLVIWNQDLKPHTKNELNRIIARIDNYLQALNSIPKLKELRPPIENVIEYNRLQQAKMAEMYETTNKGSFINLFPRVTLLYGSKTLIRNEHINGQIKRTEIPFATHSVSFEIPRMTHIDNDFLELESRTCLFERFKDETDN